MMLRALEHICDRLSERRATLFLGAGVNAGIKTPDGRAFPLGVDLAGLLCREILDDAQLILTLDEAAEQVRHKIGAPEFNRYLFELFRQFRPARCHELICMSP